MTTTTLAQFNAASPQEAAQTLRPCLPIDRWIEEIVSGRPYDDIESVVASAHLAASPLRPDEVDAALARHPRIGERAAGDSREATLSRSEQSGLSIDEELTAALRAGNAEYEARFDRVFLIRAAGRSTAEILEQLTRRLSNDDETESAEVADQLRQIAILRLQGALSA